MAAGAGLALTMAWLLLVRFGANWMLVSPILPWSLMVVTGVAVWGIKAWLDGSGVELREQAPQANACAAGQD